MGNHPPQDRGDGRAPPGDGANRPHEREAAAHDPQPTVGDTARGSGPGHVPDDDGAAGTEDPRLAAVRHDLESAAALPLEAQVEVFEQANEILAGELAALDEV
jgi:hypothetical protein